MARATFSVLGVVALTLLSGCVPGHRTVEVTNRCDRTVAIVVVGGGSRIFPIDEVHYPYETIAGANGQAAVEPGESISYEVEDGQPPWIATIIVVGRDGSGLQGDIEVTEPSVSIVIPDDIALCPTP